MHNLFDGVLPFVAVAEEGNFRGAAAKLGLTPAAVSKSIARLEERVGLQLVRRTTRRVALSEEGERFLIRCQAAVAQVRAGQHELLATGREAKGDVSVALSFVLGPAVARHLQGLRALHPELRVRLRFEDRLSHHIEDGVDVALRIGATEDSSLISRRLAETRWSTVASPHYLARAGWPDRPEDLAKHDCLLFQRPDGRLVDWQFQGGTTPRLKPTLTADFGDALVQAAIGGLGVCQAFSLMTREAVQNGALVELLPEFAADGPSIFALCLPGQQENPRVRAILDFLPVLFR